jgi:choline-sulfatase
MVRRGAHKYIYTLGLPPLLFDLAHDPKELRNLAGDAEYKSIEADLHARVMQGWDPQDVTRRILLSQRRRLFLKSESQRKGRFPAWTYEARQGDADRFVRPATAGGPVGPKPRARFPFVQPTPPDKAKRGS